MLCDPNSMDLQNLSMKEHWTRKEVENMGDIKNNPTEHRDYIIENCYTDFISPSNINDIISSFSQHCNEKINLFEGILYWSKIVPIWTHS